MAADLLAAIHDAWAAAAALAPVPLGYGRPRPGQATPYAVYRGTSGRAELTSGDGFVQAWTITFDLYAPTAALAAAYGKAIRAAFDPTRARPHLAWDGGGELTTHLLRDVTRHEPDGDGKATPPFGGGGQAVWRRAVEYRVIASGTLSGAATTVPPPATVEPVSPPADGGPGDGSVAAVGDPGTGFGAAEFGSAPWGE